MRRLAVVLFAVVVLLTGACSGDDDVAEPDDEVTGSTTTAAPADADRSCDPADYDPAELSAFQPDGIPLGFDLQPDDVGDTGPSDFAKAVRDDGFPDAESTLREERFLRGFQWLWVNGSRSVELISFLYEFCDETGAAAHNERSVEVEAELDRFEPEGVPDAVGLSKSDADVSIARVLVTRGAFSLLAVAAGEVDAIEVDQLEVLATDLAENMVAQLSAEVPT